LYLMTFGNRFWTAPHNSSTKHPIGSSRTD